MKKKLIKTIILLSAFLSLIPICFYVYKFGSWTLSDQKGDWGTLGEYLGGLISPFISFLALLVTIYIAYTINEYEIRRDKKIKEQDDIKSYLELYQYFTGPEFREKRHIGWNVLRKGIENPDYGDFIVKENFVSRYSDRVLRKDVYEKFKGILYKDKNYEKKKFLHQESEDRHKLDTVINFFQLLAIKDVPTDNFKVCDFYYDSWRPLLYWYAKQLEVGYEKYPENKMFNNPPNLRSAIEILDKKYYNPVVKDTLTFDNVFEHPILKWYLKKEVDE